MIMSLQAAAGGLDADEREYMDSYLEEQSAKALVLFDSGDGSGKRWAENAGIQ